MLSIVSSRFQKKKKRETGKEKRRKRRYKKKTRKMLPVPNIPKNESVPFDNRLWHSGVTLKIQPEYLKFGSTNTRFMVV